MRIFLLLAIVLIPLFTSPCPANEPQHNQLSPSELEAGWLLLFDGESLFGWTQVCKSAWHVEGGEIRVAEGNSGLLCTTTQWADFVLSVDLLAPADTNSGIFFRSRRMMRAEEVGQYGYEVNIAPDSHDFPTGSLVAIHQANRTIDTSHWRTVQIIAAGNSVTVAVDGEVISQTDRAEMPGRGFIGLQYNQGEVAFRNVKIKPLRLGSLFNGHDLTGWKTYDEMESRFSVVEEGILCVENGRGQLETEGLFGDFVLQLQCQVNGEGLNSGIFFRCLPGEEMNGYESQIHNGYLEDDRTRPADCGTGGIFRRQNARRVVSDDFTWFHKTIVAEGPHIAVWVNGIQVTDWKDLRDIDPNPRRGLRTEPGTIMIQGHDPTTNLFFRHLHAGEIAPRWPVTD